VITIPVIKYKSGGTWHTLDLPPGATGPPGPAGATGPAGPAGPAGEDGFGTGTLLIENGASVPGSTPVGTIIYEKNIDPFFANILSLSPVMALRFDETAGNFADSGSNGAAFTPGTGVTRGLPPLLADGVYSVMSTGNLVASLTGNPSAMTGGTGSLLVVCKFLSAPCAGLLVSAGGTSANGWALGVSDGGGGGAAGTQWVLLRQNVAWAGTGTNWTINQTYLTVMTRDHVTSTVKLYVNGMLMWTGTSQSIAAISGGGPAVGGTHSASNLLTASAIYIDCAAWWGTVLNQTQITGLGVAGSNKPKGWWDGTIIRGFV
jgi:hypothetical protein